MSRSGAVRFDTLVRRIRPQQLALQTHGLYKAINSRPKLQTFMNTHVFAVWDFMSLTKTLQQRLAPTSVPWTPPAHPKLARLINDIVLSKESDKLDHPSFPDPISHLDLYRRAMVEVGAKGNSFQVFLEDLKRNHYAKTSLIQPEHAKQFVENTLHTYCWQNKSIAPDHVVASAFLFGREDPIPDMFSKVLAQCGPSLGKTDALRLYLQRHIDLDGSEHSHMAKDMLMTLCENDETKWCQAEHAAIINIYHRIKLWNGILDDIHKGNHEGHSSPVFVPVSYEAPSPIPAPRNIVHQQQPHMFDMDISCNGWDIGECASADMD